MELVARDTGEKTTFSCEPEKIVALRKNRYDEGLWIHVLDDTMDTYLQDVPGSTINAIAAELQRILSLSDSDRESEDTAVMGSLSRYFALPEEQYVLLDQTTPVPHRLDSGIYFVNAIWSGTSVRSFQTLNKALESYRERFRYRITLIDTEAANIPEWVEKMGNGADFHWAGNGETFFVREGIVVARFTKYDETSINELREAIWDLIRDG